MADSVEYFLKNEQKTITLLFLFCFLFSLIVVSETYYVLLIIFGFSFSIIYLRPYSFIKLFLLIVFIFPFIPFHVGIDVGRPFPVFKLHRMLIMLVYLFYFFDRFSKNRMDRLKFTEFPITKLLFMLSIIVTISFLFNEYNSQSINYFFSFCIEKVGLCFIVCDTFRTEKQIRNILLLVSISGALSGIGGVFETLSGNNFFERFDGFREEMDFALKQQTRYGVNRIRWAFPHAIDFSATLAIISSSVWTLVLSYNSFAKKFILSLVLGFLFIVCFLTFSRGPIFIFWLISFIILLVRKKFWLTVLCTTAFIIVFQPWFEWSALTTTKDLLWDTISGQGKVGGSSSIRLSQLKIGYELITEHPLFGYSFNYDMDLFGNTIDNYYLRYALNYGVLGLGVYVCIFISIIKISWEVFIESTSIICKNFSLCFASTVLGILTLWSVVSIETYMYWFWIFSGIIIRMKIDINKNNIERHCVN